MILEPATVWFLVGFGLVLLEFAAPGVVIVFIGLGAWVVSAVCAIGWADSVGAQMAWFGGSSLVGLVGLRRVFKSWMVGISSKADVDGRVDDFVGQQVVVMEEVMEGGRGAAEFKGVRWAARGVAGEAFAEKERAVVDQVDGLCLVLKKP